MKWRVVTHLVTHLEKCPPPTYSFSSPRHREKFRRRKRLATRLKHRRCDPQLFRKLYRATRPPGGLHERLKLYEARRRYPVHFALAGGATGPPFTRLEVHELMGERATPLHLKQTLIEPNHVPPVRLATPPLKARELDTNARKRCA